MSPAAGAAAAALARPRGLRVTLRLPEACLSCSSGRRRRASRRGRARGSTPTRSCPRIGCGRWSAAASATSARAATVRAARPGRAKRLRRGLTTSSTPPGSRRSGAPRGARSPPMRRAGLRGRRSTSGEVERERNRARGAPVRRGGGGAAARGGERLRARSPARLRGESRGRPGRARAAGFLAAPARPRAGGTRPRFGLRSALRLAGRRPRRARRRGAGGREAGFTSLWLMDHFVRSRRSGASGRTCSRATRRSATSPASRRGSARARSSPASRTEPRAPGEVVATLDVVSGSRALCELDAGWFEREHRSTAGVPAAAPALRAARGRARAAAAEWGAARRPSRARAGHGPGLVVDGARATRLADGGQLAAAARAASAPALRQRGDHRQRHLGGPARRSGSDGAPTRAPRGPRR